MQPVRSGRVDHEVDLVLLDVGHLGAVVLVLVDGDLVDIGVGHFVGASVLDRLEVRVALHGHGARRVDLGDHERTAGRRRALGDVLVQWSARRHRRGEHQPEDVLESAVRLAQFDGDVAGVVVGLDAADRVRLSVGVVLGPDDDVVEHRAAGVGLEQPLDAVCEVGRLDGRSVRVLHVRS